MSIHKNKIRGFFLDLVLKVQILSICLNIFYGLVLIQDYISKKNQLLIVLLLSIIKHWIILYNLNNINF